MPTDSNDPDVSARTDHIIDKRPPEDAPAWVWHAYAEFKRGVHEIPGKDANARILQYFKATNIGANPIAFLDETPWCSAFACFVMEASGVKSTKSCSARSWMNWGKSVPAQYGAVVVFWRTAKTSISGHVGFYVGEEGSNIWVLGGNQNNSVSFAKYPRGRLLGYRMPK